MASGALLGVCDGELDDRRFRSSFLTNKIGGLPDWPPGVSGRVPRCGLCAAALVHVMQLYCPSGASSVHRNLHLFACPAAACGGRADSWAALRSHCPEQPGQPGQPGHGAAASAAARKQAPAATDWCASADDWGEEEEDEEEQKKEDTGSEVTERLHLLRLPSAPQQQDAQDAAVFRSFFISVLDESDVCCEDDLSHARRLLAEYERREGVTAWQPEGGGSTEEAYEKTAARHGDAVFSRFMKRVSRCPQQVVRYCRGASPLFISRPPADMMRLVPACGACGAARTFELQLMPALVSLLRRRDGGEAELEFGTTLVFTCSEDCRSDGAAVAEFCFVQTDPDQPLFR